MNEHAKANGPQTERSPIPSERVSTTSPASGSRQRPADDTLRPERFTLPPEDAYNAHDTIPSPPPDILEE